MFIEIRIRPFEVQLVSSSGVIVANRSWSLLQICLTCTEAHNPLDSISLELLWLSASLPSVLSNQDSGAAVHCLCEEDFQ